MLTSDMRAALAAVRTVVASNAKCPLSVPAIMGLIAVESSFVGGAVRYEKHLAECSYGLMQLLKSTAADMGFTGDTSKLFDPIINIGYGVEYLIRGDKLLAPFYSADERLYFLICGYNEGYGAASKKRRDDDYFLRWLDQWKRMLSEAELR